jgi:hypothetical protein
MKSPKGYPFGLFIHFLPIFWELRQMVGNVYLAATAFLVFSLPGGKHDNDNSADD